MKTKQKGKRIKGWAIIDIQKRTVRPCYAKRMGTQDYANGLMACYFKKPVIGEKWKPFKQVSPVTITLHLASKKLTGKKK